MIQLDQRQNETRKHYLLRLALAYIRNHSGTLGVDDKLFYDDAECDGFCLADDIKDEFMIKEDD